MTEPNSQTSCDPLDAIGVFDSGIGGLTVVRRLVERLPQESIIYLGDTARVPYGAKSPETVIRYARACARVLLERRVKFLVAACNTASALALTALREELDIPVLGVIEPGARAAALTTRNRRIGVIGTAGTIASQAYPRHIAEIDPGIHVFSKACPLFVPLAEEGWTQGSAVDEITRTYLTPLLEHDIDTLVLGCTHYPLLTGAIAAVAGPRVTLVDSATATADAAVRMLDQHGLNRPASASQRTLHFLVSDGPQRFAEVGCQFLGYPVAEVEWVDF